MSQKVKANHKSKGNAKSSGTSKGSAGKKPPPKRYGRRAVTPANRTWWLLGAVALVLVAAVLIAVSASGGDDQAKATKHETGAVTVDGDALPQYDAGVVDTAIGDPIPTLSGVSFDGSPVTIGPTGGKPQVVVFVAHWCPHCQAEVPRIVELAKAGAFKGIDVSTVTTATSSEAPNYPPSAWLKRENWPFPVLADSPEQTAAIAYGLTSYPYLVFTNAEGNVVGRAVGEIAPSDLQKILTALAAGKPLPKITGGGSSAS
jgi:cytochrome c biogenesis protein CcmG/thiol:disulfide interchange protein DsbE